MGANSLPRRILKRVLAPVLNEQSYKLLQTFAMAYDIRSGGWKEPELELIRYAVSEGDHVIDIGANYGLYAYHLSKAVGRSGRVYAFEPLPFTAGVLKNIARLLRFQNVEVIEKGCSAERGQLSFTVPVQDNGAIIAGTVHLAGRNNDRAGKERHARFTKTKEVVCEVVTIDEFLAGVDRVSFIKCDIEGADLYALRGARRTIERHQPLVLCEINPWFLEGFGIKLEDLIAFFSGLGYQLHRYEDGKLRARTIGDVVEDNWVFVPESRRKRLQPILA